MSAAAAKLKRDFPFSADAFRLRCEARAMLYAAGEYTLIEAVDVLQLAAERDGLVELIGADAVQAILAEAFSEYRESSQ